MAVVSGASRDAVEQAVAAQRESALVVSAEYASDCFMLSGPRAALDRCGRRLDALKGTTCAVLKDARHAYHSPLHAVRTDPTRRASPADPTTPLFSCAASGRVASMLDSWPPSTLCDLGALYAAPVHLAAALDALVAHAPVDFLLDLSLKGDLTFYFANWARDNTRPRHSTPAPLPTLRPHADACERLALCAAQLALAHLGNYNNTNNSREH